MARKPTAAVHIDKHGFITYHAEPECSLLIIDDRCERDRVYEIQSDLTQIELASLIGSDDVGHAYDGSGLTEEAAARLHRSLGVRPPIRSIKSN